MIDFVWGLSDCQGYKGLLTIVDLFSKLCRAVPVKPTITSEQTASLIITSGIPD
jgi:hypothetical protein